MPKAKKHEYYAVTNSFAAPFCSDTDTHWVKGDTPEDAMARLVKRYNHPAGLYAAVLYKDANAEAKGAKPLCRWICNEAWEQQQLTKKKGAYTISKERVGEITIDGVKHIIEKPREGAIR